MLHIPSICDNPFCKLMFPSGIVVGAGPATLINCKAGPCPRCGFGGSIPSGEYRAFQINIFETIFKIGDIDKLQKIKETIEKALNEKSERRRLNNNLKTIIPENVSDFSIIDWTKENEVVIKIVLQFLSVLIAALVLLKSCALNNVTYETTINQTFNQFYEFPSNESHGGNQIENKNVQIESLKL